MSRYVNEVATAMGPDQAAQAVAQYMQGQGFAQATEKGEAVWKKGGLFAIPQFVKAEPGQGSVHLEAWVATLSILPGIYVGESDLTGAFGFAIKAQLRKRVAAVEAALRDGAPAPAAQVPSPEVAPATE